MPATTRATVELPGGGTQELSQLTLRITEYTVGSELESRLPGPLPPSMDPTYAVELTADEAVALGGSRVEFSQPLTFLVENFTGIPTGNPVASAWWDASAGRWTAAPDGLAIEVLLEAEGRAIVDVTGRGEPASAAKLAELGISGVELERIAALYSPGARLLRGRVDHFSSWYWGVGISYAWAQAFGPRATLGLPHVADDLRTASPSVGHFGGVIDQENLVLREGVPLAGTSLLLTHASDWVPGRRAPYRLEVPLAGAEVPPELASIELEVTSGGKRIRRGLPAAGGSGRQDRVGW